MDFPFSFLFIYINSRLEFVVYYHLLFLLLLLFYFFALHSVQFYFEDGTHQEKYVHKKQAINKRNFKENVKKKFNDNKKKTTKATTKNGRAASLYDGFHQRKWYQSTSS